MKLICGYIQLKDKLTLGDFLRVISLTGYITRTSKKWEIRRYENEILKTLTTVKHPFFLHRRKLPEVMEGAGFKAEVNQVKLTLEDVIDKLEKAIRQLSATIQLSPEHIKNNFTDKDFQEIFFRMEKDKISHYMQLCNVQKNPTEFFNQLKKINDSLRLNKHKSKKKLKSKGDKMGQLIYFDDVFKTKMAR